ncbi:unnamed protein product [Caenorhabditis brenneri]
MLGVLCFLVFGSALGQITNDFSCTYQNLYSASATACSNNVPDAVCQAMYPETTTGAGYPGFGNSVRRPFKCTGDTAPNADMKAAAITNCPKTCGFCCLTQAFNCSNAAAPRIDCNTVTLAMCQSSVWRQVLTEDCPAVCGFCPTKPYVVEDPCMTYSPDAVPNCQAWALVGFCTSPSYTVAQKKQYCATTCKLC